jgi:hypothetical protein
MKCSFCNQWTFALAFADRLPWIAGGHSAGSADTVCWNDALMLRVYKDASLPLASNCMSECYLLLPFQLLQTCHHRTATQQLFAVHAF